jgi:hypothetical protein
MHAADGRAHLILGNQPVEWPAAQPQAVHWPDRLHRHRTLPPLCQQR